MNSVITSVVLLPVFACCVHSHCRQRLVVWYGHLGIKLNATKTMIVFRSRIMHLVTLINY